MATALSHEINQPLGAAAIYLSAARRLLGRSFFKPSGVENALAKAADQVTRAGQIVGRMRSFVTRGEPDATAQSMYELAREAHELASGAGLSDVEVSTHHPRVHMIVPGGGISLDGQRWVSRRSGFFLPVRVLWRLFRRR